MQILDLPVEKRENFGTADARRSRRGGKVPCMLYGGKQPNVPLLARTTDIGVSPPPHVRRRRRAPWRR